MIGKEKIDGDSRIHTLKDVDSSHAKKGSNMCRMRADYTPADRAHSWTRRCPYHRSGLGLLAGPNSALDNP
jgi:hypothetical protein